MILALYKLGDLEILSGGIADDCGVLRWIRGTAVFENAPFWNLPHLSASQKVIVLKMLESRKCTSVSQSHFKVTCRRRPKSLVREQMV